MRLSVVIPCLNEAQTLAAAIKLAKKLLTEFDDDGEIVVADNGSSDGSQQIATDNGARVVNVPKRGYGYALIYGIHAAKGDIIVMGDADATYNFAEAKPLVDAVAGGCDLAMGSRLRGKIERGAMPFLHRYLGTPVLTWMIRLFFRIKITDCNCGMRAFSKAAFEKMNLVCGGMEFASEMLVKAAINDLNVEEYPISLAKDTRNRKPHLNTWRDGWRHMRFILLFAPHVIFTIPGYILTTVFGFFTIVLSLGVVTIDGVIFDYHHLFYSIPFFTLGIQLLWFARFASEFRKFAHIDKPLQATKKFPLEFWLFTSSVMAVLSIVIFLVIFVKWYVSGRGELLAIRQCAFSLTLFLVALISIINSLMISMLELQINSHKQ